MFLRRTLGELRPNAAKRATFRRDRDYDYGFFWDEAIPLCQRMLQSACNSKRVDRKLFFKAIRLGASLAKPVYDDGSLAHFFHARHGESTFGAQWLQSQGADLLAVDHSGRGFAHYAFIARNRTMCGWLAKTRPDLCFIPDAMGLAPIEMALGESLHGAEPPEDELLFLEWMLSALGERARRLILNLGFSAALALLPSNRRANHFIHFQWLERMGAAAPSGKQALDALASCQDHVRACALEALAPLMAMIEAAEISQGTHTGGARPSWATL